MNMWVCTKEVMNICRILTFQQYSTLSDSGNVRHPPTLNAHELAKRIARFIKMKIFPTTKSIFLHASHSGTLLINHSSKCGKSMQHVSYAWGAPPLCSLKLWTKKTRIIFLQNKSPLSPPTSPSLWYHQHLTSQTAH